MHALTFCVIWRSLSFSGILRTRYDNWYSRYVRLGHHNEGRDQDNTVSYSNKHIISGIVCDPCVQCCLARYAGYLELVGTRHKSLSKLIHHHERNPESNIGESLRLNALLRN